MANAIHYGTVILRKSVGPGAIYHVVSFVSTGPLSPDAVLDSQRSAPWYRDHAADGWVEVPAQVNAVPPGDATKHAHLIVGDLRPAVGCLMLLIPFVILVTMAAMKWGTP